MKKSRFSFLASFVGIFSFLTALPLFPASFFDEKPACELAEEIVKSMSDSDALAQTLMLGWRDISGRPSALIQDWITLRHIGAVKIFGWNTADTEQLAANIGNLQRRASQNPKAIPLLAATDQEGGLVRHVKGSTSETPGAMAIGASGVPQDAFRAGYYIGKELAVIGINMNFAPLIDLYTNHGSVLIGPRSFGDNPVNTGIMGIAFAKGLLSSGIIPTAKHFPGHGDTEMDSHGVLPSIEIDFDTLWERELVPYRMMIKDGIPAIMSGHIAFPNTESKSTSASLSSWFLDEILRKKIGFNGLIITDDLIMNGATSGTGSLWRTAKQALAAGNDIIMMSSTPEFDDPVWVNLLYAMENEPDFNKRVREAAVRVLKVKLTYLRGERAVPLIPDLQKVRTELPDKEGGNFFRDLAARSVTIVKNENGILPISVQKAGKVLVAFRTTAFRDLGKKVYNGAESYWYPNPGEQGYASKLADFVSYARAADTIIFHLSRPEEVDALIRLRGLNKRIIVLSTMSPASFKELPWINAAVAVYSSSDESIAAGFSVLLGTIKATGAVPFALNSR